MIDAYRLRVLIGAIDLPAQAQASNTGLTTFGSRLWPDEIAVLAEGLLAGLNAEVQAPPDAEIDAAIARLRANYWKKGAHESVIALLNARRDGERRAYQRGLAAGREAAHAEGEAA